jgi:hypothetical protein
MRRYQFQVYNFDKATLNIYFSGTPSATRVRKIVALNRDGVISRWE